MKNLFKIYDIFKSNKEMKEADSLSDISKITKNILISKKKISQLFFGIRKKNRSLFIQITRDYPISPSPKKILFFTSH